MMNDELEAARAQTAAARQEIDRLEAQLSGMSSGRARKLAADLHRAREQLRDTRAVCKRLERNERRMASHISGWGNMAGEGVAVLGVLLTLTAMGVTIVWLPPLPSALAITLVVCAGLVFGVAPMGLLRRWVLRVNARALDRERTWIAALPYPVQGYFELFARPDLLGLLEVRVHFSASPDRDVVARAPLAPVSGQAFWEDEHLVLTLSLENEMGYNSEGYNTQWLAPLRQLLGDRLVSLHARQPISSVRIG